MFHELVEISNKVRINIENGIFGGIGIIEKIENSSGTAHTLYTVYFTPPEQRAHYTP